MWRAVFTNSGVITRRNSWRHPNLGNLNYLLSITIGFIMKMCTCHGISAIVLFPSHHINKISKRKGSELNSRPVKSFFYEPVQGHGHGGVWWISWCSQNHSWMRIVINAQSKKLPCTIMDFAGFPSFNSLIPGKLQSESFSPIFLFDHESTAVKSKCFSIPTETWEMLIDVSGYTK